MSGNKLIGLANMRDGDTSIEDLRNLGPASAEWLHTVGIVTLADLKRVGAVGAWQLVRTNQPRASLNLLYAMHGALTGQSWQEISAAEKDRLRQECGVD